MCLCCAVQVLEELHGSRGLLVDLPSAVRADAGECATKRLLHSMHGMPVYLPLAPALPAPPSLCLLAVLHSTYVATSLAIQICSISNAQPFARRLPLLLPPAAAPALPNLPPYLVSAAASAPAPAAAVPASRGSRNALQYLIDGCHARLPWIRYNDKGRLTVGNL